MEVSGRARITFLILLLIVAVVSLAAVSYVAGFAFVHDALDIAGKVCGSGCSI